MARLDPLLARVLGELKLPVFVFEGRRELYSNAAGDELADRLRVEARIELRVVLLHHIYGDTVQQDSAERVPSVTLLTSSADEPFYIHVFRIPRRGRREPTFAVSVRSSGADVLAFRRRYRLSTREAQIAELVRRGSTNQEISQSLGIALATTKKHLGRIFDKVGVDSRAQLMARLG